MTDRAVVMLCLMVLVYLLPTMVAFYRGHHVGRVLFLNVATGWTGIGWLFSFGLALT